MRAQKIARSSRRRRVLRTHDLAFAQLQNFGFQNSLLKELQNVVPTFLSAQQEQPFGKP
jgi:hypothetical protein